jgi:cation/acetate symporter
MEVRQAHSQRAELYRARLKDVDTALRDLRQELEQKVRTLKAQGADFATIAQARRELLAMPPNAAVAREQWQRALADNLERAKPLGGMVPHALEFRGDPNGDAAAQRRFDESQLNFLALVFCLMVGTAGLPHLLTRYYTTPTVAEARTSVAWSLFFIALLYLSAPVLAVLVKFELMNTLAGSSFESLPSWIAQWARIDPALVEVADVNGDRILQWGELKLGADIIMLATPELGGMPFVVSGLVAAGGLAAALSTADGLLLTISNALVHDMGSSRKYTPRSAEGRVILSKFALLAVAMLAAFVAALKPAQILSLVSASFSLAAAALFPAMVMGLRFRRVGRSAAVAGMLVGLGLTTYYMVVNGGPFRQFWGLAPDSGLWFGIQPLSSGVFGVSAGFATIWLWSWLRPEKIMPTPAQVGQGAEPGYPGL